MTDDQAHAIALAIREGLGRIADAISAKDGMEIEVTGGVTATLELGSDDPDIAALVDAATRAAGVDT